MVNTNGFTLLCEDGNDNDDDDDDDELTLTDLVRKCVFESVRIGWVMECL